MSFISPQPCGDEQDCCPVSFTGFCLEDETPIAIVLENGIQTSWINLLTGVSTVGPPPAGTHICATSSISLSCVTDSISVCQLDAPWSITGNVTVTNEFNIRELDCTTDSISVCQLDTPWEITGTVDLSVSTLTALETITVNQGTSPWVISSTDLDIRNLDCLTDSVSVCQETSPWVVSGEVDLSSATLAALEFVTVNQGTNPWLVDGFDIDIRDLDCATDSVSVCQLDTPWEVTGMVISQNPSSTASLTNVSGSVSSVQALAANTNRKGFIIVNDSVATLYVKYGVTASTTSFTVLMIGGAYFEDPFNYTGRVDMIWTAATGAARVTELT